MEAQEPKEDSKMVMIFGHLRSRKELFINGIVFLLINCGYSVFNLISQLPEGFRDNPELIESADVNPPSSIITIVLMLCSYILIDRSIFGNDVGKMVEKYGMFGYFLRKFSLAIGIVSLSLLLLIITLIIII